MDEGQVPVWSEKEVAFVYFGMMKYNVEAKSLDEGFFFQILKALMIKPSYSLSNTITENVKKLTFRSV